MKPVALLGLALALVVSPASAAVDPGLLNLVMPEATAIAGVQVGQAQGTPLGQFLVAQLRANGGRDLEKLLEATGFDPVRDLQEVVVAASESKKGVLVGRGVFQPGRIAAAAKLAGAVSSDYRGMEILGNNGDAGLVFLDASTIAIGDNAALKAVIDRRVTNGFYSGNLAAKVREVSGLHDAWFVATTPATLFSNKVGQPNEMQARLLQTVQQVAGGIRLDSAGAGLTAEALTASAQDAQALADVLRFLAAMAQGDAKAPAFLSNAQFSADGSTTRITLDIPQQQVESMFSIRQPRRAPQMRRQ